MDLTSLSFDDANNFDVFLKSIASLGVARKYFIIFEAFPFSV